MLALPSGPHLLQDKGKRIRSELFPCCLRSQEPSMGGCCANYRKECVLFFCSRVSSLMSSRVRKVTKPVLVQTCRNLPIAAFLRKPIRQDADFSCHMCRPGCIGVQCMAQPPQPNSFGSHLLLRE